MIEIPKISAALIDRYGGPAPRYTSYPTVPHWLPAEGSQARRHALASADPSVPLSVYAHIPFCEKLCNFCGCNVIVRKNRKAVGGYLDLVEQELDAIRADLGHRPVHGLHLGGGTPTFMTVDQFKRLTTLLHDRFNFTDDADLALEVNPTTTNVEQIVALGKMGFRRISLGVQDTDPNVLKAVGRTQTLEQTRRIIDAARGAGFTSVNIDLIYGLPEQTTATWESTLERIMELAPDRIAVFAFAYVPTLLLNQKRLDERLLPSLVDKLDLYRQAYKLLVSQGYASVGLDHFARNDDPLGLAASGGTLGRNFQGYVADDRGDLLGIGISSISQIGDVYAQNYSQMKPYRTTINQGVPSLQRACRITAEEALRRRVIMTLMCHQPVDLTTVGFAVSETERSALRSMASDGIVRFDGQHIQMTEISRPFLRRIASTLDPAMGQAKQAVHSQSA